MLAGREGFSSERLFSKRPACSLLLGSAPPRLAGAWYGAPASLAATTECLLNSPGFSVAAIGGLPWFTEARNSRFPRAAWIC